MKLIYLFHYYQVDCRLTSRSVAMSNMRILGGQTRRKSSMLVTTPASKTHNLLQRSARTRYTEMRPVQLMSPRPAVCHDQSGYACRYRNIYCDQNYFQKKTWASFQTYHTRTLLTCDTKLRINEIPVYFHLQRELRAPVVSSIFILNVLWTN